MPCLGPKAHNKNRGCSPYGGIPDSLIYTQVSSFCFVKENRDSEKKITDKRDYIVKAAMYSTLWTCPTAVLLCLSYLALRTRHIFLSIWHLL